jgi:hypothetical protein
MDAGFHNTNVRRSAKRLREQGLYRDNSTIIITPTRADGDIAVRVAESHAQLGKGMNQRVHKMLVEGRKLDTPWFKTQTLATDGKLVTQDLFFFEKVRRAGYKVASDNRVRVGHYDARGDFGAGPGFVW